MTSADSHIADNNELVSVRVLEFAPSVLKNSAAVQASEAVDSNLLGACPIMPMSDGGVAIRRSEAKLSSGSKRVGNALDFGGQSVSQSVSPWSGPPHFQKGGAAAREIDVL